MRSSPPDPLSLSLSLSLADVNNAGDQSSRRRAGHRSGRAKAFGLMPTALCGRVEHDRKGRGNGSAGAARYAHLAVLAGQGRVAA